MAKKNQKHQKDHKQPDQPLTSRPTAPTTPLELSDEELEQVAGGCATGEHVPTGIGGLPSLTLN